MKGTGLSVLAVDPTHAAAPALDAQALGQVVEGFRDAGFDHIIVDGPPAIDHSDARYVARCVEGAVMCIHAGASRNRSLRRALDVLGGTPVLGYVLLE
jgi:Mrp family chromosome partitioning ATPase